MFMFDPLHVGDDSVVMISQHDKPLIFNTLDECREHVNLNLGDLNWGLSNWYDIRNRNMKQYQNKFDDYCFKIRDILQK